LLHAADLHVYRRAPRPTASSTSGIPDRLFRRNLPSDLPFCCDRESPNYGGW